MRRVGLAARRWHGRGSAADVERVGVVMARAGLVWPDGFARVVWPDGRLGWCRVEGMALSDPRATPEAAAGALAAWLAIGGAG